MNKIKQRIGLLGGTFDPIHFGHINPALTACKSLNLDKVWLMPNHIPPHKASTSASSEHRLAMVKQICLQYPQFEVCDIEIKRDTPSYSVTTLELLNRMHPDDEFYFIMGMDSFVQMPTWFEWQKLFTLCNIVLCQRPGWQLDQNSAMAAELTARQVNHTDNSYHKAGDIILLESELINISSTEIRQSLLSEKCLNNLLPTAIIEYIHQHKLYTP